MFIESFLHCPYCGDDGDVSISGTFEHIEVECSHCQMSVKEYLGNMEGFPDP